MRILYKKKCAVAMLKFSHQPSARVESDLLSRDGFAPSKRPRARAILTSVPRSNALLITADAQRERDISTPL